MDEALFFAFTALAVLSALLAVTRKNAVASACWLVVMFFGLAGVFVLVEAFFVATAQILVYAGAIMVLFLFVIMLLDLRSVELAAHQGPKLKVAGVVLAGLFLAAVLHAISDAKDSPRIADRVAAVLRRPAPTPPTPPASRPGDDATAAPPAPKEPAPETVELSSERPDAAPARPELAEAANELTGDRAFGGAFMVAGPASGAEAGKPVERRLKVTLESQGKAVVAIDAKRLPDPTWDAAATAHERHATLEVPGAAAGTRLDLTIMRGGLDPTPVGGPDGSPRAIGRAIFEEWLLPFEVASILLTGAIFGAVVLTKRRLS